MCLNHASPYRNSVLFLRDVGGAEQYQIYHFDLTTAKYALLSDGVSKYGSITWASSGDRFAYYSTQRNGKDWDIYVSDLPKSFDEAPKPEMVLSEGGSWYPMDWSHDGSKLLAMKYISANESQVYVLHLAGKALIQVNPSEDKISYGPGMFTKDGNGLFMCSDEMGEFKRLYYFDLSENTLPKVLTAGIPWDVDSFELSPDGKRLVFITNEDGISVVYVMDTATFQYKRIANSPVGLAYSARWHPNNKQIGIVFNTAQTPGDIYTLDAPSFEAEGGEAVVEPVRWTFSEVGGLNTDLFVVPSLIHFETFDEGDDGEGKNRTIPAFYYKPRQQASDKKLPVIITIHGGPESQWRPQFIPRVQYYCCEMGVAVLAPNVRGSSGYGKSYLLLDNGFKREDSVKDIGMLIQWVKQQPELDADRVMVDGGSYGGFMVLASMIRFGKELCCGVERVGISNFVTFLENTSAYRRDNRREEYGDERIPEMRKFLLDISPTSRAHEINKPMFISQGANDPRVPESESEQIVQQIRKPETAVWYMLAKDEGHGFKKKANIDFYLEREAMFVEQYLLGHHQ
jgi:dipeptidyl aminopeptidase/acylaminoacyl peptidase